MHKVEVKLSAMHLGGRKTVVMGIGWNFIIDHRFKVNERLSIIIGLQYQLYFIASQ